MRSASVSGVKVATWLVLMFASTTAWAVWNEAITITGENPPAAGSTVVFQLPDGQQVDGRVEEDDDELFVVFALPGDRPSAGTLLLGGKSYAVPVRSSADALTLNLDTAAVEIAGRPSTGLPRGDDNQGWMFELDGFFAWLQSDHLENQLDISANEVVTTVLPPTGATDISATVSADDDDNNAGVGFTVRHVGTGPWGWYTSFAYLEADDFSGVVSGTGLAPGDISLEARSVADSELEIYQWVFGTSYDFGADQNWRVYLGVGATQVEVNDEFITSLFANDVLLAEMAGSSDKKENGTVFEAGLQRQFGDHFFMSVEVQAMVDAIENMTQVQLGLGARL